jgi:hypothetical protein
VRTVGLIGAFLGSRNWLALKAYTALAHKPRAEYAEK